MNTRQLTSERNKTHGDFSANARISQELKMTMYKYQAHDDMTLEQREALDMICLKLSRILSGNTNFRDHWDDIAGYAHLAAESCEQK